MNKQNLGKKFENLIKTALDIPEKHISIDRLPDPLGGYSGITNICDFTSYKFPFNYFLECKCTYDNTLNFKSSITEDQWQGMLNKSNYFGCLAGVCVWFISYDTTAFVPIQELQCLKEAGKKSLHITDLDSEDLIHFKIKGIKKRVYFEYDGIDLIKQLTKLCANYWDINSITINDTEVIYKNEEGD